MRKTRIALAVVTALIVSAVGGYVVNAVRATFTLTSWSVADDEGWPSLKIAFNAVGSLTVVLYDPSGERVDNVKVSGRMGEAVLRMADFHRTPKPGVYRLVARNPLGVKVFEREIEFDGVQLEVVYCWINVTWDGKYGSITGMNITLRNVGDVLTYPCGMGITVGGESDEGYVYPIEGLLPGEEKSYRVAYGILWLQPGTYQVTVRIYDAAGYLITIYETTITIPP